MFQKNYFVRFKIAPFFCLKQRSLTILSSLWGHLEWLLSRRFDIRAATICFICPFLFSECSYIAQNLVLSTRLIPFFTFFCSFCLPTNVGSILFVFLNYFFLSVFDFLTFFLNHLNFGLCFWVTLWVSYIFIHTVIRIYGSQLCWIVSELGCN